MDSAAERQSPMWHPVNGGTYCATSAVVSLPIKLRQKRSNSARHHKPLEIEARSKQANLRIGAQTRA